MENSTVENQQANFNTGNNKKKKIKYLHRRSSTMAVSFSAKLPDDVCTSFQECIICAVKYSKNPFMDIRESIIEIIENVGVKDWDQMEELVYCFIALNSTEVRSFIVEAFLSLRLIL